MNIIESRLRFADGKGQYSQTHSATRFSPDGKAALPVCLSCKKGNIEIIVKDSTQPVTLTGNTLLLAYMDELEALQVLIAHSQEFHSDKPIIVSGDQTFTLQQAALIFELPEETK
jgi:hypothetical protein